MHAVRWRQTTVVLYLILGLLLVGSIGAYIAFRWLTPEAKWPDVWFPNAIIGWAQLIAVVAVVDVLRERAQKQRGDARAYPMRKLAGEESRGTLAGIIDFAVRTDLDAVSGSIANEHAAPFVDLWARNRRWNKNSKTRTRPTATHARVGDNADHDCRQAPRPP